MLSVIESISHEIKEKKNQLRKKYYESEVKKWYDKSYDESGLFRLFSCYCWVICAIIFIAVSGGIIQYLYTGELYATFLYGVKYSFFMCAIMTTGFLLCIPTGAFLIWVLQGHMEEDDEE